MYRADFFPDFPDLDLDCLDDALEIQLINHAQERIDNPRIKLAS